MILLDSGAHPGLLHSILQGDYWLFFSINQAWTSPFLDGLFLFMRESELWVPFYLFLLVFITLNFRKKGWWWAAYLIMTAIIGDLISSKLIKDTLVMRTRPCGDPLIADSVRFIANYCPTSSSFTSSHACNHFALAFFIYRTLRHTSRWWSLVFVWAFLIAYAQVYVGVHFPLDVTCGALIGSIIGWQLSRLFRFQFGTLLLQPHIPHHA
ncbi:MAG: phosphatase PAP2 family protein [Bacteroidetes bacterium]|nr:phosphatase PAP2 family protein [Bacteroidota bacterium]